MSSKLTFPFEETSPRRVFAERIRREFKTDFGLLTSIPIFARFKKPDRTWTRKIDMAFDTGANISLLPKYIGIQLSIEKSVPHRLSGIAKRKECIVPVEITRVTTRIEDPYGNETPEFQIWTAIADRDDVPTILGMKDIVNNFKFESDPKEKKLHLIWRP